MVIESGQGSGRPRPARRAAFHPGRRQQQRYQGEVLPTCRPTALAGTQRHADWNADYLASSRR